MEKQKKDDKQQNAASSAPDHTISPVPWGRERGEKGQEVTSTWTTACLCLLKARKSPPLGASFWCCHPPSCRAAPASGSLLQAPLAGSDVHPASAGPTATERTNAP